MVTIVSQRVEKGGIIPCIKLNNVDNFDIDKIFDCGQCFRFDKVENSIHEKEFSGIAFGKFISFAQDGKDVCIYNSTEEEFETIWKHYLALDVDYEMINDDILSRSDSPDLAKAVKYGNGIRILVQDRWEAICSFIISQNNRKGKIVLKIKGKGGFCFFNLKKYSEIIMEIDVHDIVPFRYYGFYF